MPIVLAGNDADPFRAIRVTGEDRLYALAEALAACECHGDLNVLMASAACRAALRGDAKQQAATLIGNKYRALDRALTAAAERPATGQSVAVGE